MKLTIKERKLVKEYIQTLKEDDLDNQPEIQITLKLTKKEYSELIGAIWDSHSKSSNIPGSKKINVLRSLKDKLEKYYNKFN